MEEGRDAGGGANEKAARNSGIRGMQGRDTGGKVSGKEGEGKGEERNLRLRIELDLDVELELKARIKGSVTLALLG